MEKQISFAEFIKNEILDFDWDNRQLDILFYSLLKTSAKISEDKIIIGTTISKSEERFQKMFDSFFSTKPEIKKMSTKTKYIFKGVEFVEKFYNFENNFVTEDEEDLMAFVAGSFLATGWASRPSSRQYHLEFRIGSIDHTLNLREALESLGIEPKMTQKDKWYIIYIKKSMLLADLLKMMKAYQATMIFEDERITRDMTSTYTKIESIEAYNQKKIQQISEQQIKAINYLIDKNKMSLLSEDKRLVAEIRLENPHLSLWDIQYKFNFENNKNVSKSTINNWLKSIVEMANKK